MVEQVRDSEEHFDENGGFRRIILLVIILLFILVITKLSGQSVCYQIQDDFYTDAELRGKNIVKDSTLFLLQDLTNDTLAVSYRDNYDIVIVDKSYYQTCLLGKLYTLIYHELAHLKLRRNDKWFGSTIMNYKYLDIDLLNDPNREKYLKELFK